MKKLQQSMVEIEIEAEHVLLARHQVNEINGTEIC